MRNWATILILLIPLNFSDAALPKPAWDCDDDKIDAKYFNEVCVNDTDCFGFSMTCHNGRCACKENQVTEERFVGELAKQTVCVPAPSLFFECKTICQKPFKCALYEGTESAHAGKKICQCQPPFKLTDGRCYLECQPNQYYNDGKYLCMDKCQANQIRVNDSCHPIAQLNDACVSCMQCQVAFSHCTENKCSCVPGFSAKDGLCSPDDVRCPNGKILAVGEMVECKLKARRPMDDPSRGGGYHQTELYDECPEKSFCHVVGGGHRSENNKGFCCPRAELSCPVGRPHPTGKCSSHSYDRANECPWQSHYCHSTGNGNEEACCLKRCDNEKIFLNGKCYHTVEVGDFCQVNEQCRQMLSACIDGVCKCSEGSTAIKEPTYTYCTVKCQPGELSRDHKCHKPLSLGESCKNQTWRCPTNAICNKYEVCSCACPRFTLSQDVCAPVPTCPRPRRGGYSRTMYMVAPMAAAIKGYQPISDREKNELLQNITFCAIPNKEAPKIQQTVAECAENQYCAQYIDSLGICCKKPDFVCLSGKKPVEIKNCDPRNPLSCGVNQHCHDFLYTADPESAVGKMCCARENMDDDN